MAPYLESVKVGVKGFRQSQTDKFIRNAQSFADVPISDAGVDTAIFLEAADGLVGLFGRSSGFELSIDTEKPSIRSI
jgi:hypothetical protein